MSGERVLLPSTAGPFLRAAVAATGVPGIKAVLIGGFAVSCRLGHAHRATADVDTVADEAVRGLAAVLADLPGAQRTEREIFIEGVAVQVITTAPIDATVQEVEPRLARLFVISHRYGLQSAEMCRVVAGDGTDASLPIATPAALIAMKTHALADRSDERKKASDATDLIGLIDRHADRAR